MTTNKEDFLFGTRAIIEAIHSGKNIEKVLIRKGLKNDLYQELDTLIKEQKIPNQSVPVEKLNRITRKNHQGVIAFVSPIVYENLGNLLPMIYESGEAPLLLILDQITDVRNFGAIARSAECAGVHGIIIPEKGMARIGADAVKTSAGALLHIPVCKTKNLKKTVEFLADSGLKIVAATEKGKAVYTESDFTPPLGIIMGSEEHGISPSLLQIVDEQLQIPIMGRIESLNVSVASALMIYEAVRQRSTN